MLEAGSERQRNSTTNKPAQQTMKQLFSGPRNSSVTAMSNITSSLKQSSAANLREKSAKQIYQTMTATKYLKEASTTNSSPSRRNKLSMSQRRTKSAKKYQPSSMCLTNHQYYQQYLVANNSSSSSHYSNQKPDPAERTKRAASNCLSN